MADIRLIRGYWKTSRLYLAACASLVLAGALSVNGLFEPDEEFQLALLAMAALSLAATVALYREHRQQVTRLFTTPTGFRIMRFDHDGDHDDADVLAVSSILSDLPGNGTERWQKHTGEFVVAHGEGLMLIPFDYRFAQEGDPHKEFFQRNLDRLMRNARASLEAGLPLPGVGWTLTTEGIRDTTVVGGESIIPSDDIASHLLVDGEIRIWRRGQERASLAVPLSSLNAGLLLRLLSERIERHSDSRQRQPDRIVFERHLGSARQRITLAAAGIAAVVFGVGLGWLAWNNQFGAHAQGKLIFLGGLLVLAGLVWIGVAAIQRWSFLSIGDSSIIRRNAAGEDRIPFELIESYSWRAVFGNRAVFTNLVARFEPVGNTGLNAIRLLFFGNLDSNAAQTLEGFHDWLANVLGARLRKRLADAQSVPWCGGVSFEPTGLLVKLGRSPIPYQDIEKLTTKRNWTQRNVSRIHVRGKRRPAATLIMSEMNFYPGYNCLQRILNDAAFMASLRQPGEASQAWVPGWKTPEDGVPA